MKEYGIVDSGDAKTDGIGAMTEARWRDFFETMVKAGVYPADLDFRKAFTLQFVNKKVGHRPRRRRTRRADRRDRRLRGRPLGRYCIVERDVGTMRVITIFSRSSKSGICGPILVFQKSVSYTDL